MMNDGEIERSRMGGMVADEGQFLALALVRLGRKNQIEKRKQVLGQVRANSASDRGHEEKSVKVPRKKSHKKETLSLSKQTSNPSIRLLSACRFIPGIEGPWSGVIATT